MSEPPPNGTHSASQAATRTAAVTTDYTKLAYLGREYVGLVLHEYHRNRIDRDQLADFLDTKPKNVATLEEYYLQGGI